jgi:hypothetical protein
MVTSITASGQTLSAPPNGATTTDVSLRVSGATGRASRADAVASDTSAAELARVESLLKHYDVAFEKYQLWAGLSVLAVGGITLPLGFVIHKQTGSSSPAGLIVIGVGGGEVGAGLLVTLGSSGLNADFTRLYDSLDQQRSSGKSPAAILVAVESEWKKRAEAARSIRRLTGVIETGLGVAAIGTGTYLTLEDVGGLSKEQRYNSSAALLGLGGVSLMFGLRTFFFEDEIEVAWSSRHADTRPATSLLGFGKVAYVPMRGGGVFSLRGAF